MCAPPPPWRSTGRCFHGERIEQRDDRHGLCGAVAADGVPVAVGQDDHVAFAGPVALAVGDGDPARSAGDDVEEDEALGPRVQRVGERERRRLERERLGELGPEEDRALEAKLLEC